SIQVLLQSFSSPSGPADFDRVEIFLAESVAEKTPKCVDLAYKTTVLPSAETFGGLDYCRFFRRIKNVSIFHIHSTIGKLQLNQVQFGMVSTAINPEALTHAVDGFIGLGPKGSNLYFEQTFMGYMAKQKIIQHQKFGFIFEKILVGNQRLNLKDWSVVIDTAYKSVVLPMKLAKYINGLLGRTGTIDAFSIMDCDRNGGWPDITFVFGVKPFVLKHAQYLAKKNKTTTQLNLTQPCTEDVTSIGDETFAIQLPSSANKPTIKCHCIHKSEALNQVCAQNNDRKIGCAAICGTSVLPQVSNKAKNSLKFIRTDRHNTSDKPEAYRHGFRSFKNEAFYKYSGTSTTNNRFYVIHQPFDNAHNNNHLIHWCGRDLQTSYFNISTAFHFILTWTSAFEVEEIMNKEGVIFADISAHRGIDNFLMQYRNASHSVTGKSPAILFKSRSLRTSLDCAKTADVTFFKGNDLRPAAGIILSSNGKRIVTILYLDDLSCHRRHIDQVEFNTRGQSVNGTPAVPNNNESFVGDLIASEQKFVAEEHTT
ncbi:hypothetical protein CLF_104925, partial [Clonorchis sinensis]